MTDKRLWVICDTSGSMNEGGKKMLVRNLLTYLHQVACMSGASASFGTLKIVAWGELTEVVEFEDEILPFRCKGKASVDGLANLLSNELADASRPRLLFMSDGQWHHDDLKQLCQWRRSTPNVTVRVIAIGADASARDLRQLADESALFAPEEVWAALDSWNDVDATTPCGQSRKDSTIDKDVAS